MCSEVYDAFFECIKVFCGKLGLRNAAVVFEGADSCDKNYAGGLESGCSALDIEELLGAEIGTESCFGDAVIAELEGKTCGSYAVAAVCYISEKDRRG